MNLSRIFIERPVATLLLMIAVLLSGLLSYRLLPQSALPQVDYPTIQVVTLYPGASPEVMATAITSPLERQFGAMTGLSQMFSSSSGGASVITLQFALHVSLDQAEQYVQAAINAANNFLPTDLPTPPVFNKVNPADAAVLTLAIRAETLSLRDLRDLVENRLLQKISQVSGVGLVSLGGGNRPAVRVRVNPQLLASLGMGLDTVQTAISAVNSNQAKGSIDGEQLAMTIDANSQLNTAADYREQIIAVKNGAPIRLGDIAEVTDDVESKALGAWVDGRSAILLSIQRQPGANVIQVVDHIRKILPDLEKTLPAGIHIDLMADRTESIRGAIHDVKIELLTAVALVIMVIFLFLRTISGTLIPSLAVPLSLIGTFSVMYLAGFSVNNLTLMAMTIATGFVVDDAIVMIENISRFVEEGHPPFTAALLGAKQIGFTIITLTISLIAVLIPLLFMQDIVGRLFREFASTLAIAILISGGISITLTPMLSARLLKSEAAGQTYVWQQHIYHWFERLGAAYASSLRWVLQHQRSIMILTLVTFLLTVILVIQIPKGFFPVQDNGLIQGLMETTQSTSFQQIRDKHQAVIQQILQDPAVDHVASSIGVDGTNATLNISRLLITLKPYSERQIPISTVIQRLSATLSEQHDFTIHWQPVQDLTVETRSGPTRYQLSVLSLDAQLLKNSLPNFIETLQQSPELTDVGSSIRDQGLKAYVDIDRDAAGKLGVSMAAIDNALYSAFGQRFVSTIFTQNNQYRVVLDTGLSDAESPDVINQLYVTAASGGQIPLSSMATIKTGSTELLQNRQDQFPAALIYFNVAPGYSLGNAVQAIQMANLKMDWGHNLQLSFEGSAKAFQSSLNNELILVIAAIITMYIVLGVLYESYIHPLTILSTLPSAAVGALLALQLTGHDLDIIAIIGIVLLIGIVQKNAIMMIDFALEAERVEKKAAIDAIYQACILRFRPILMTTCAAIFSAVPLVLGTGVGSELREPLGIVMIGGLLFSQILTLYTVPVVYLAFDRLAQLTTNAMGKQPASRE